MMQCAGGDPLLYQEDALEQFLPVAQNLAARRAWQPFDQDDLVQEGLLALLKSMREYREKHVDNPLGLALTVMDAAMKWHYKPRDRDYVHTEIMDHHIAVEVEDELFLSTFYKEYLAEVERLLGGLARAIVENLVTPGEEVLNLAIQEMEHKQVARAAGKKVRGFNTLVVKHEHVRHALGVGEGEWYKQLGELRKFSRQFLSAA